MLAASGTTPASRVRVTRGKRPSSMRVACNGSRRSETTGQGAPMTNLAASPAFLAYALSMVVLSLNLLVLWAYSGSVRGKTKTTPNAEDAGSILRGAKVVDESPPEVARVLRAHANAMANIVPFAILALVYVL